MSEQTSDRAGLPNLIDRVKQLIPANSGATSLVPVVRLSGVIGAVTPARLGLTLAGIARTLERVRHQTRQGGGAGDQFARRLAGAIAPDLFADQAACRGKETAGAGVRRGRRGIRRLHMIACAGDEIFCDPSSILGSIGVVGGSFGFQDLLKELVSSGGFTRQASTRRCSIRSCLKTPMTWRA